MLYGEMNFTYKLFIDLIVTMLIVLVIKKLVNFIKYYNCFLKLPKDPNCTFLLGDLLHFIPAIWDQKFSSDAVTTYMTKNASHHQIKSGIHGGWLGWWPIVILHDYKAIEALVRENVIHKPIFYKFTGLREGLISSVGQKWKMRRKMIEPFFVSKQTKKFAIISDSVFAPMINGNDFCEEGKYLTLVEKLHSSTGNIILNATAGVPIEKEQEEKNFLNKTMHLMETNTMARICNPPLWFDWIFNVTKAGRKTVKMMARVYKFLDDCIIRNEEILNESDKSGQSDSSSFNFVKMLLTSNKGKIDLEGINEELLTAVSAGHDSSALTLNTLMFILGNYPDIQEKVYQEISSMFGENESVNDIERVKHCEYLDKCLKESMRLYPAVPLIARELEEPIEINGYNLPKGSILICNIFNVHRDPRIYPDPTQYDPERFDPSNLPNIPKGAYIPFGVIPRACTGSRFALIEMKIFLIHLIRKYKIFSAKKLEEVSFEMDFTLKPSSPLEIMLRKRTN
ncbi:cytochrome P450 4V2-like [Panonychus citri]|uniref:cytochrome P450 4V2-like n=1 Tax=Panonychus citri TaxID=50023 RepID=UPI002308341D|nr:cytochrome P450 4V2-like [Panonychus citri]